MVLRLKSSVAGRVLPYVLTGACLGLAACGQKGALTLPAAPATAASSAAAPK